MRSAEDRYRALPDAPSALANQPTVTAANESVARRPSGLPRLIPLWRYALSLLSVGLATWTGLILQRFNFRVPQTLLLLVVAISSWYGGPGPAVLAGVLSVVSFYWYFIEPVRTIYIYRPEIPFFVIFVVLSALLAWFGAVRRRAETELRERADLLNLTHDTVFVMDMEGVIKYWNRGAEEQYGWTAEQALGKVVHDLLRTVFPAPLDAIKAEVMRMGRWEGELLHTRKDGTHVTVASRWSLERGKRGDPVAILETNNDITERKRAEEALCRLNRELRAISNCNQTLLRATDEQSLLEKICRIVCEEAGYRMAFVAYAEHDEAKTIRPVAWTGTEAGYLETADLTWDDTDRGRGPTGTAMRTGESCCIQDLERDPRVAPWTESLLQRGFRSAIALPLKDEQAIPFGSLTICSAQPNAFTVAETALLEELAGDLAYGITTLRTRAERERAQEALRISERRYRTAEAVGHVGNWEYDVPTKRYWGSDEAKRMFGFDPGQTDFTIDEVENSISERGRVHQALVDLIEAGKPYNLEFEMRPRGSTEVRIISSVAQLVRDQQGNALKVVGSIRDITESKHAEHSIALLSFAVNKVYDAAFLSDAKARFHYVNEEACRALGYTRAELLGMTVPDIDLQVPAERWPERWLELKAQGTLTFESCHRTRDGRIFPVEIRGNYLEYGGGAYCLALVRDITERKRAEEALRQSEAYLAESQRLSHTGSWAFDVAGNKYVYISEECARIFELDAKEGLPTREAVSRLIHAEDWDKVQREFEKLLREKVDTSSDFRVVLPSGATKHIQAIRHPVLNETGDVVTIMGTAIDITERKRAEEELRESEKRLAQERDRLKLLLEINNHIVSKLQVDELFRAVGASIRKYLGSDVISFLLLNKQTGCLERKYLDFPTGKGILEKASAAVPSKLLEEWWRARAPVFYSPPEADIPAELREADRAESILSAVSIPLMGVDGPLGLFNIASQTANAFNEADRDLLSQIGTQISLALDNALAYGRLRASHENLEHQRLYLESEISSEYNFEDIVGKSSAIKGVLQQVSVVAPTDSIVLLHGETGTGKELIARAIHNLSSRRDHTFVRMNCAAIPSGLLESELFGHEKGAFTGALMQRRGRFELADHGSLFLDEIGDISLELQPKLLRAVQEQEFERLGSAKTICVDVRIIAATHRDLRAMIREGRFREDLFYRLNVFPIEIPPLRDRREDIPLLVNHFVSKASRQMGKTIRSIPKETMEVLTNHPWRGNVRELANFIERAVILTQGDELQMPLAELGTSSGGDGTGAMTATVQEAERAMIMDALRAASGRISGKGGAAERLGLKRTTLQHKMQRLGISPNPVGRVPSNLEFRNKQ